MKKIVLTMLVLLAWTMLASPVRSVLGSRGAAIEEDDGETWENPYVTDGLVAMWDGEWNVGPFEHSDEAEIWKDLAGENDLLLETGMLVGEDYIRLTKKRIETPLWLDVADAQIEVVIGEPTGTVWYDTIVGVGGQTIALGNPNRKGSLSLYAVYQYNNGLYSAYGLYGTSSEYWTPFVVGVTSLSYPCRIHTNINSDKNCPIYVNSEKVVFSRVAGLNLNNPLSGMGQVVIGSSNLTCEFHCIRIYSRRLSAAEVLHNYLVDKERFGL
jgi:hypothetical protein